jgi:hypothetical protein
MFCFRFLFKMESDKGNKQESNAFATGIYEIPGETAIIINGVPAIVPGSGVVPSRDASNVVETHGNLDLGDWFVGRDVQKLFRERYYSGKVINYDKESGWYKVEYEDGDLEDLDWQELKEVILPLDATISLKTLAQGIIRKNKKPGSKSGKKSVGSQNPKIKTKKTN